MRDDRPDDDRREGLRCSHPDLGALFSASCSDLYPPFEYATGPGRVVIDLADAHIWDASTVATPDAITAEYDHQGKSVEIVGLNESSARRRETLSAQLSNH